MKKIYTSLLTMLCIQLSVGQTNFQQKFVDGEYYSSYPTAITVDLDNDGDMDVISADGGADAIFWFENNGSGIFGPSKMIVTDLNNVKDIFSADFDNDGDLDIVFSARLSNYVGWIENLDGLGNFGIPQIMDSNITKPTAVFAADFDSDGDMDILSSSYDDDRVVWYENLDGLGNFSGQIVVSLLTDGANSIFATDIDNDGDIDVLSASWFDQKIAWYANDGLGNFGNQQVLYTHNTPTSVYAKDIDNDGDIDVLSSSYHGEAIYWSENLDGLGNYGGEQLITNDISRGNKVFAEDLDGDGDQDALSASENDNVVAWYENIDGLGTFGVKQIISQGNLGNSQSVTDVLSADMDNDGDFDVISTSSFSAGRIAWYENLDGQGAFGLDKILMWGPDQPTSSYPADIDNDGDMDIISSSQSTDKIVWHENLNGLGSYATEKIITLNANSAQKVIAVDINNDGFIDVVSASKLDDKIAWYENINGTGNFNTEQVISVNANNAYSVYSSDIDGDGDIDILSASSNDDKIAWYENLDGLGNFSTEKIIALSADGARDVFSSDIDGDGDMDVLSVSYNDDKVAWYENTDGLGNFGTEQIISLTSNGAISIDAADIDGDGDIDVISASSIDNKIAWYENTDGLGSFGTGQIVSTTANNVQSIIATDINNNGIVDIASSSFNNDKIAWYENIDGLGAFVEHLITNTADGANSINAADLNGDGLKDIIATVYNTYDILWFQNLGPHDNQISGTVNFNFDTSDCNDNSLIVRHMMVSTTNGSDSAATFTSETGTYQLTVDQGVYVTQVNAELEPYFASFPEFYNSNFNGIGNSDFSNFCLKALGAFNDLNIAVYPSINAPRPGFDTHYELVFSNDGTTVLSGSVDFEFDSSKLSFLSSSEAVGSQSAGIVTFYFSNLTPFETRKIDLYFNIFAPPTTNIDDILTSTATINPVSGDETEDDNTFTLNQTVIGSYDPNDITCLEGDQILIEDADKYLHYLIRFQNTGTASAINVRVENVLDDKFDWTTMQLESLSHTGRVEIRDGSDVSFIFSNINLPDSTNDEPNSHGYIAYKIKPLDNVEVGDVFNNTANIFFDFNPAITTNTATTEIVETLSIDEFQQTQVFHFPNPVKDKLSLKSDSQIQSIEITDIMGKVIYQNTYNALEIEIDVSGFKTSMYFVTFKIDNLERTIKILKE